MRLACAAVCLGCLLAVLFRSPLPAPGPELALLAVAAALLELNAVPLPGSRFTASFAPVLAGALVPSVGPAGAAGMALLGALLKAPLEGPGPTVVFLTPNLVALAGCAWLPPVLGVALYLPLAWALPARGAYPRLRAWQLACVVLLGPALASLLAVGLARAAWLLPVLAGTHYAVRLFLRRREVENLGRLADDQREERNRRAVRQAGHELLRSSQAVEDVARERRLLEELSTSLGRDAGLESVLQLLLEAVVELVPCDRAGLLLYQDQRLVPARWHGPRPTGPPPLTERCWESGQVARSERPPAAALPLQREAVLYVERFQGAPFTPLEGQYLSALAGAGGLAVQSARRFQAGQLALRMHETAHAHLSVWARRLEFLIESARTMAPDLSTEAVLERLRSLLELTLPHQAGAVCVTGRSPWIWPPEGLGPDDLGGQLPLLEAGRMAAPLVSERGVLGRVVLRGDFTPEQLDVLQLIACQAGVSLHNALLHQEVVEARAQLVQTSKLAAVGQLAAGVAHELSTPLTAALMAVGMARLGLEADQAEMVNQKLAQAESAGARCQGIIQKLLYYARDAVEVTHQADLNQIVGDTLELIGLQLKGVTVETELAPVLPPVRVDASEIQQVVSNLLVNARDACLSPGALGQAVRLRTAADEGTVRLEVLDRGPGIEPDLQERIFEAFFTTKAAGQGTGLGLSVSREILARHGGSLTLDSEPGRGTRFVMTLPRSG